MKVLVACEESQSVTTRLRNIGIEAYSCDIIPTSGNYPEWHILGDVTPLLQDNWNMIIAFPPCTHLAVSGAAWFEQKRKDGRQQTGIEFFMQFTNVPCKRVVIENPVGIMSTVWRKPDQTIQPYQFGDPFSKKTCLWLKGVPMLSHTNIVIPETRRSYKSGRTMPAWYADTFNLPPEIRAKVRSKTFSGIADAMANQWGVELLKGNI